MSSLEIADEGPLRILRLTRPDRLNALDHELRARIVAALRDAAAADGIRVVLLTGAGERAFCAGQDLDECGALGAEQGPEWIATWADLFDAFLNFPKPLVAAVNGVAAGAGFEIAMFCDVRLSVPRNRFIMSEINVGLPTLLGSYLLDRNVFLARMTDVVLTGRTCEAEEMRAAGFLHDIAPPTALMTRAREIAASLAAKPPTAMRLTVGWFRQQMRERFARDRVLAAMTEYQCEAVASGEPQKAMAAFLARRAGRKAG